MTPDLLFDFTVDKTTNTIHITREFAADLDLVWEAFTNAEILDQWVAPQPWRAQTKEMDFREGGRWLYAMISPENVYHWSLTDFLTIEAKTSFTSKNSFSDENGNQPAGTGFTFSITETKFSPGADYTTVRIIKKMADLAQLEKFVAMGFREGMQVTLKKLDVLLATLSKVQD
ncbi:MAG: SRPBCC domain-containing protein [Ferruginibacter sp.]